MFNFVCLLIIMKITSAKIKLVFAFRKNIFEKEKNYFIQFFVFKFKKIPMHRFSFKQLNLSQFLKLNTVNVQFYRLDKKQSKITFGPKDTVQSYYEKILNITPANQQGIMTFDRKILETIMNNCKSNANDVDILLKALFNFIGHKSTIVNKDFDEILLKIIQLGFPEKILETLEHHAMLMYFPHYSVTEELIKSLAAKNQEEFISKALKIFSSCLLIKLNDRSIENLSNIVMNSSNQYNNYQFVQIVTNRPLKELSQDVRSTLYKACRVFMAGDKALLKGKSFHVKKVLEIFMKYNEDDPINIINLGIALLNSNLIDEGSNLLSKLNEEQIKILLTDEQNSIDLLTHYEQLKNKGASNILLKVLTPPEGAQIQIEGKNQSLLNIKI